MHFRDHTVQVYVASRTRKARTSSLPWTGLHHVFLRMDRCQLAVAKQLPQHPWLTSSRTRHDEAFVT